MKRIIILFSLYFFVFTNAHSQQIKVNIDINSQQINISNKSIFDDLRQALTDYINQSNFIETSYKINERIECNMFIIINSYSVEGDFTGSLQITSYRPIYGTTYKSPIFTFNDKNFDFKYAEGELLVYNPLYFRSNLLSMIDYYCYLIIAIDMDSFSPKGGDLLYQQASREVDLAISSGYSGWNFVEKNSRVLLLIDLKDNYHEKLRQALYDYHIKGMDRMYLDDKTEALKNLIQSCNNILDIYEARNSSISYNFLLSKQEELNYIFEQDENNYIEGWNELVVRLYTLVPEFSVIREKIKNQKK